MNKCTSSKFYQCDYSVRSELKSTVTPCICRPTITFCLTCFSDSELKEEKLQNLPSFLEALGFIVEEMEEVLYRKEGMDQNRS